MRHGFGIGHGYFNGWLNGGTLILIILLILAVVGLFSILSENFRKEAHPEHIKLLEILKEKYARGEIDADAYRERSIILGDEYWLDSNIPAMMILKERYANCEIDSREYIVRRDELKGIGNRSALDVLKKRYAKGEISSDEYEKMKKDI